MPFVRNLARRGSAPIVALILVAIVFAIIALSVTGLVIYNWCRIDVPARHIAVLTTKTGKDLANGQEVAPDQTYKGLQPDVLSEGRYFRNPYYWDWAVYPMIEIPEDKLGVRVKLHGEDLPYGHFLATNESQKGIVAEVLRPGRYAINAILKNEQGQIQHPRIRSDYLEIVELHEPVTIPAGFKGVVTNLAGPLAENPNQLLVATGIRGVQQETLNEGTYYLNPYMFRIQAIDCRSQRFNLAEGDDMGFPSKDGFWVSLNGSIEFRVKPDEAAKVYVLYNEIANDPGTESKIHEEIVRKVIMPNARSFCRLEGSNSSGRDFIGGETRSAFQVNFETAIRRSCNVQGIDIVQAVITDIKPPQAIAKPISDREVSHQTLKQFQQQKLQQEEEAKLATEIALVSQKQRLIDAEREVVKLITDSKKRQEVALAEANRDKNVAAEELLASKDMADAILAEKHSEAAIINFANEASAAGWKAAVRAFNGDGRAYARYVLYQKLAPGFKSIMTNTADSPLMRMFDNFANGESESVPVIDKPAELADQAGKQ